MTSNLYNLQFLYNQLLSVHVPCCMLHVWKEDNYRTCNFLLMGVFIDILQKCGNSIMTELQSIWRGIRGACDEHMQSGCEHPLSICTYQLCTCAFEIINRLLLHILCLFSAKSVKNMQNNNDLSLESLSNVWEAAGSFFLIQPHHAAIRSKPTVSTSSLLVTIELKKKGWLLINFSFRQHAVYTDGAPKPQLLHVGI